MRGRSSAIFLFLLSLAAASASREARAEQPSFPRFHAGAQVGGGFSNADPTWVGGVGLGGELGVRASDLVTFDATLMLETGLVFYGRSNVGVLFSIEPGDVFVLGLGGGVGGLYALRFGYGPNTASYAYGAARTGFRFAKDRQGTLLVGAEGNVGATYAGTIVDDAGFESPRPIGTLVGGARLYFGFETN